MAQGLVVTTSRSLWALGVGVILSLWVQPASSQSVHPVPASSQSPLRLVVPFTPGTGIDLIARTVGPKLAERLGRPVVVENRPGASGNIGTEAVVRAAPNGNTLLVSVNTLVMNRSLYPQLTFDPVKDLVPVALTSWGQLLLVANPATGFKSVADVVRHARARPGQLSYASPGVGTPHHLAMELFKNSAKVYLTHIPYRGTAPAVTDLVGGQVDVMFLPIHVALAQAKAGRLVVLAIGSDKRHRLMPQVPTFGEVGFAQVNVDMWYGLFAPTGTSVDWVRRLHTEVREILAAPELRASFETQGMEPATSSPDEFQRMVAADALRWDRLIKAQDIHAE